MAAADGHPAEGAAAPAAAAAASPRFWFAMTRNGETHFEELSTAETAWELPSGAVLLPISAMAAYDTVGEAYFPLLDEEGTVYFEHAESGETLWNLPLGARVVPPPKNTQ